MAQVAVCSQINTKHINTVWAERGISEYLNGVKYSEHWASKEGSTGTYICLVVQSEVSHINLAEVFNTNLVLGVP